MLYQSARLIWSMLTLITIRVVGVRFVKFLLGFIDADWIGLNFVDERLGVQIFVEHWGDNLQFYPNFALFSTLGEMNLDHHFFQVSKLSEEQNNRSSPKMEHFFTPNSGEDQKKGLHQKWNQARSQKYANGGTNSQWGGLKERSPQRSKILHFLAKIA